MAITCKRLRREGICLPAAWGYPRATPEGPDKACSKGLSERPRGGGCPVRKNPTSPPPQGWVGIFCGLKKDPACAISADGTVEQGPVRGHGPDQTVNQGWGEG